MDMYLWDQYENDQINSKIKYWVDLWEDLIESFNKNSYGLNFSNPQLLLKEIIDEIDYNEFKNNENRNFFYRLLNDYYSNDPVIKNQFQSEFKVIRRIFNSDRVNYLYQLCKAAQDNFRSGNYFKLLCDSLIKILSSDEWCENDQELINVISQHTIVEFLLKGFKLDSIKEFPKNIFDKYHYIENELVTNYYLKTERTDFEKDNDFDFKSYENAIKSEIDSLTIRDRLERFKDYYFLPSEIRYVIFQILGLKGDNEIAFGDINFYSPFKKSYLKKPKGKDTKLELFDGNMQNHFLNAAVKVSNIDPNESVRIAVEKLEKSFDFLHCYLNTNNINLEISSERYFIVNEEGKEIGFGFPVPVSDRNYKLNMSISSKVIADHEKLQNKIFKTSTFLFKSYNDQSNIERKIDFALHWFGKGKAAKRIEDRLLNYWIVIESLLTFSNSSHNILLPKDEKEDKNTLAKEFVTAIQINHYIYNIGWELYHYISRLINSTQGNRSLLSLPHQLIEDCNLNPKSNTTIILKQFIENLSKLKECIEREIIKDKINLVNQFYNDNAFANNSITNKIQEIKDDILLIYRYRNQIVHNAVFDRMILPYYINKVEMLSFDILNKIIESYISNNKQNAEQILFSEYIKFQNLTTKLKDNSGFKLFEIL